MSVKLKVDSKGRIRLPREVRERVGDIVILEKTENGFVLRPGELTGFLKEFREVIASLSPKTGEPENWPPSRMKTIWRSS